MVNSHISSYPRISQGTSTQSPPSGRRLVVVEEGDTLWQLSRRFGVDCQQLAAFNNLSSHIIKSGEVLNIPPPPPSIVSFPDPKKSPSRRMFGLRFSPAEANAASQSRASGVPVTNSMETASNGRSTQHAETLPTFGADVATSASTNPSPTFSASSTHILTHTSSTSIAFDTGSSLSPSSPSSPSSLTPSSPKEAPPINTKPIEVQEGDSAWEIATRFGLSLDALLELNRDLPDPLYPGDILQLPAEAVERPRALMLLQGATAKIKGTSSYKNANFWDVFPPPRAIESYQQQHRVLLHAIRYVESSFIMPAPVGDNGLSIGPLQISDDYHTDAWWLGPTHAKYEHCERIDYSERTVINYWLRYCPWSLEFGDPETLARTHNGGPGFYHYPISTAVYWRKVKMAMRHAGWFQTIPELDPHLSSSHLAPHGIMPMVQLSLPISIIALDEHDGGSPIRLSGFPDLNHAFTMESNALKL